MRKFFFFVSFVAIILLTAITGGFILMWRLLLILLVVAVAGLIWVRFNSGRLTSHLVEIPDSCEVGDSWNEIITIKNDSLFPKFMIELVHELPDGLISDSLVHVCNIPGRGKYQWSAYVTARQRGIFQTGLFYLRISHPAGLTEIKRQLGRPKQIIVFPRIVALPYFDPFKEQQVITNQYNPWSLLVESGSSAARVREYTSSERRARIYWPATAHSGRLMVKEFDNERFIHFSRDVWIVADLQKEAQIASGIQSTDECMMSIIASLVKKYQEYDKQIGLIAYGDRMYLFQPAANTEALAQIMMALVTMKAEGNLPLYMLLQQHIHVFQNYSQVVIISPSVSQELVTTLYHMQNKKLSLVVIFLEFGNSPSISRFDLVAKQLNLAGIQTYIVRKDADLARALDYRNRPGYAVERV